MKILTSFIALNTGEGERISFTYSEVGEDGTIISQNNKKNFLVPHRIGDENMKIRAEPQGSFILCKIAPAQHRRKGK